MEWQLRKSTGGKSKRTHHAAMPSPAPSAANATVFEARGLRKVYHTGELDVVALHGVDLSLSSGELVVLLGASGSGKSTLLNILGGLDTPTGGEAWFLEGEYD